MDPRPYQASYRQALAALARDKANAENARRESERYATLAQKDYVTKEQADQQRANAAATAATVAADEAQVSAAKFNLDNATIRAPISGRTGALLVKEGNLVHASGGTPLVVINQVSPILVRFAIPATQLPLLQKYGTGGGLAVVATPNSGSSQSVDPGPQAVGLNIGRSDPGVAAQSGPPSDGGAPTGGPGASPSTQLATLVNPENGTLTFIDNAVDTTTGTVLLKASFPNPNQRLWAGEFVSTQLRLFVEQKALVVPTAGGRDRTERLVCLRDHRQQHGAAAAGDGRAHGRLAVDHRGRAARRRAGGDGRTIAPHTEREGDAHDADGRPRRRPRQWSGRSRWSWRSWRSWRKRRNRRFRGGRARARRTWKAGRGNTVRPEPAVG